MKEFFAHLYEWFGLVHIYSRDLGDFLRGWDYACVGYFAIPWYFYIGFSMIVVTGLIFGLQYDLIDSKRFRSREHWELAALIVVICNFLIAFSIPFVAILKKMHCAQLDISVSDCIFFGLSVAVWSFVLFSILSGIQHIIDRRTIG